jgi:hypothetical protein
MPQCGKASKAFQSRRTQKRKNLTEKVCAVLDTGAQKNPSSGKR